MRKVPKLRFKEFSDEWEEKNILELCSMKARIGWQNLRKEEHLERGEYYLITGTDFYLDKIKWDTAKFVEEERYLQDKNIILKEGDILITKDGSIGKLAFVENIGNKKATLNNGIFRIRIEKEKYYPKYLYYTFLSKRFKTFLQQLTAGSTIVHLYQKDFEKYKISYSCYKEQEKIANFLSGVDKKISLTEEKLELFGEYKKGVMQKIFSQELRFKDNEGNDYPEWNLVYTKDISKITMGFTPSTKDETMWNGKYKWLSIADLKENGKYIFKTSKTITERGIKNKKILSKGTLVMSFKLTLGRVGILSDNMFTNEAICHFHWLEEDKINTEYIYYYLSNIDITNFGKQAVKGITLNTESLNSIEIQLPILEEQQKIANFLSSIDEKIEKIENELENLKEFKKGLLQQMFV